MAAKIVFVALLALLAVQGSSSTQVKRDLLSDAIAKVKGQLDQIKASLDSAFAAVKDKFQELKNKADQALSDAKNTFADMAQEVQDKIDSLQDKISAYGGGVKTCVQNNKDQALAIIKADGSDVSACISSTVQTAVPLVKNATDAVTNFLNLYNEVVPVLTTCGAQIPTNPLGAAACFVAQGATIAKQATSQVTAIIGDVDALKVLVPQLKTDIDNCSAEIKTAQTDVDNIVKKIQSCVDDYVSNSTTTTAAPSA